MYLTPFSPLFSSGGLSMAATALPRPEEMDVRQEQVSPVQRATRPTPMHARLVKPTAPMSPAPLDKLASPGQGPQAYETADCGTPAKPITCCTHGEGGASCNLFMLLCDEGGRHQQGRWWRRDLHALTGPTKRNGCCEAPVFLCAALCTRKWCQGKWCQRQFAEIVP